MHACRALSCDYTSSSARVRFSAGLFSSVAYSLSEMTPDCFAALTFIVFTRFCFSHSWSCVSRFRRMRRVCGQATTAYTTPRLQHLQNKLVASVTQTMEESQGQYS